MRAENCRARRRQEVCGSDRRQLLPGRHVSEQRFVAVRIRGEIRLDIRDSGDRNNPGDALRRKTESGHQREMPARGTAHDENAAPADPLELRNPRIQKEASGLQTVVSARRPGNFRAQTVVDIVDRHFQLLTEPESDAGESAFLLRAPASAVNRQDRFCFRGDTVGQIEVAEPAETELRIVGNTVDDAHWKNAPSSSRKFMQYTPEKAF